MPYRRTDAVARRLSETRERIVSAALAEVAERGYAGTSMAAVAARAAVATGTLYNHFPGKSELFTEVFRRASAAEVEVCRQAATWPAADEVERLGRVVETFARRALRGHRLAWALLAEPVDPAVEQARLEFRRAYRDIFVDILDAAAAAGAVPDGRPHEVVGAALVGAIGEALVGPLSPHRTDALGDLDALVTTIVNFCVAAARDRGVRT